MPSTNEIGIGIANEQMEMVEEGSDNSPTSNIFPASSNQRLPHARVNPRPHPLSPSLSSTLRSRSLRHKFSYPLAWIPPNPHTISHIFISCTLKIFTVWSDTEERRHQWTVWRRECVLRGGKWGALTDWEMWKDLLKRYVASIGRSSSIIRHKGRKLGVP